MKKTLTSAWLIALLLSIPAQAAVKKGLKASPNAIEELEKSKEISIPMARGELQAEIEAEQNQRERANAPRTQVQFGVSSWKPAGITTASRIPNATDFESKGIPALNVSLFSPLLGRELQLEFGLGLLAMQRTGTIKTAGLIVPQDQNGYLTMVRLGVTFSPWKLLADRLSPYVSAIALPSIFFTRRSSFDDGATNTGAGIEFGVGSLVKLFRATSLDLRLSQVEGRIQNSELKGRSLHAGLRMPL